MDIALAIGVVDLLHLASLHRVCLVTSDTDFLLLVQHLRKAGCEVLGIGSPQTSPRLRDAYTDFVSYEELPSQHQKNVSF